MDEMKPVLISELLHVDPFVAPFPEQPKLEASKGQGQLRPVTFWMIQST